VRCPTDEALEELECAQLTEFYERVYDTCRDGDAVKASHRLRRLLEDDPHDKLCRKLALLLPYCFQNLSVYYRGELKTKLSTVRLEAQVTKPQRDRWFHKNGLHITRASVEHLLFDITREANNQKRRDKEAASGHVAKPPRPASAPSAPKRAVPVPASALPSGRTGFDFGATAF